MLLNTNFGSCRYRYGKILFTKKTFQTKFFGQYTFLEIFYSYEEKMIVSSNT